MRIAIMCLLVVTLHANAIAQGAGEPSRIKYCLDNGFLKPPELPGGNAAIEWCKLWMRLSDRQFELFADLSYAYKLGDPLLEPRRKFLEESQQFLDDAAAIAVMSQCDWGLKSWGKEDRTPVDAQLTYLHSVERMLYMDAERRLEAGRTSAAVDRLIAALRCGRHFAKSSHISATLVGGRICAASCEAFEYMLEKGKLDAAQSRRILSVLREYPSADPFGVAPAWRIQAQFTAKFFRTASSGDHPMLRLLGAGHWTRPDTMMVPLAYAWSLTPDQFERDIQRLEAYYELVAKAMEQPNPEVRLRELFEEAREGQHGITIALITPAIDFVLFLEPGFRGALRRTVLKLAAHIAQDEQLGSSE